MMIGVVFILLGAISLSFSAEVCYEPCGCWSDDAPFDERPLPTVPGGGNTVEYELFTTEEPDFPIPIHWDDIPSEFNPNRKTVIYFHGWNSGISSSYGHKNAFYDANHDVNFISVDWADGAGEIFYPQAASNARLIGACSGVLAAQLVARGASWADIHCIGYSLGAHVCGYMGISNNNIGRITGLDPAGPWFDFNDPRVNLDRSDGQFVDIIHTNVESLGTLDATGHVDHYPNNGRRQPGCGSDGCDHGRAVALNVASILNPNCQFSAKPCVNEIDADLGFCDACGSGCNRLGYYSSPSPSGRFWLATSGSSPYCLD